MYHGAEVGLWQWLSDEDALDITNSGALSHFETIFRDLFSLLSRINQKRIQVYLLLNFSCFHSHFRMVFPILVCGLFGGLATIFGKISFSDNWIITSSADVCSFLTQSSEFCYYATFLFRAVSFVGIIACNAFIVGYFLTAMEQNNSVVVVVISSAVNFLISGILGQVVFGEAVAISWFAGSALIIIGMLLVTLSEGTVHLGLRGKPRDST